MNEILHIYKGLTIGDGMIFITLDLIAFLITLMLILRIGTGELSKVIFLFALSFLLPAIIPLIFGTQVLWWVPFIQTIFSLAGIYLLMKVLGVFELMSTNKKERPTK